MLAQFPQGPASYHPPTPRTLWPVLCISWEPYSLSSHRRCSAKFLYIKRKGEESSSDMGKKGGPKKLPNSNSGSHAPITLREEATGKLQTKPASNIKSILRFNHLKKLAVWASNEAQIPSLAAFYGQHLATFAEATGLEPDPSLMTCQRCESVLHPGFNSTVRIEKNISKVRHKHKKSVKTTQNNVVFKCHFCSHRNLKRGAPKGHTKEICPFSKLEKGTTCNNEANETNVFASRVIAKDVTPVDSPATPSSINTKTMLEGKKRRRGDSTSKKAAEAASMSAKAEVAKTQSTASKRRRKSWTSLKEIAQSNDHCQVANLTIPIFL